MTANSSLDEGVVDRIRKITYTTTTCKVVLGGPRGVEEKANRNGAIDIHSESGDLPSGAICDGSLMEEASL